MLRNVFYEISSIASTKMLTVLRTLSELSGLYAAVAAYMRGLRQ